MTERIRRPPLERAAPIRNWTTLFTTPLAASAPRGDGAAHPSGSTANGFEDVVTRSVGLGYRVIDEYIQQGQRAARAYGAIGTGAFGAMGGGPFGAFGSGTHGGAGSGAFGATGNGGFGPMGGGYGGMGAMPGDPQMLASRMAHYATEMASLWFALAGLTAGGMPGFGMAGPRGGMAAPPPPAAASAPTPAAPAPGAPAAATTARVLIASARPTEVAVDLRLDGAAGPFAAQALRGADAGRRVDDVGVELASDGTLIVRIRVRDDQPAGRYDGALVDDASGRTVGWITLTVDAAA